MKLKRIISVLLIGTMVLTLAGCGGKKDDSKPLAKVGEVTITQNALDRFLAWNAFLANMDLSQFSDEASKKYIDTLMLEQMITESLVSQHIKAQNREDVFPENYEKSLADFKKAAAENAADMMKENNIDEDFLKEYFDAQFYGQAMYTEMKETISDLETKEKDYYEKNKAQFTIPSLELSASHILLKTEAEATAVKAELVGGADFATLAKEKSTEPAAATSGGELGSFGEGAMVQEFWDGAKDLKIGEISDPVKTEFGYHIIKVTDRKEAGTIKPFESVLSDVESYIVGPVYQKELETLRKEIGVEYLNQEEPSKEDSNKEEAPKDDTVTDGATE